MTIKVKYENGVLRPFKKVNLKEGKFYEAEIRELFSQEPLTTEEMLELARQRANTLSKQYRKVVVEQHKRLIEKLQMEVKTKEIEVKNFPNGD